MRLILESRPAYQNSKPYERRSRIQNEGIAAHACMDARTIHYTVIIRPYFP